MVQANKNYGVQLGGYSAFSFIGKFKANMEVYKDEKDDFKEKGKYEQSGISRKNIVKYPNGYNWKNFKFMVDANGNKGYVQLSGGSLLNPTDTVPFKVNKEYANITLQELRDKLEADKNLKYDEKYSKEISAFYKSTLKLDPYYKDGEDYPRYNLDKVYVYKRDMMDDLQAQLVRLQDKNVRIWGAVQTNIYNGNTSFNFEIKGIKEIHDDELIEGEIGLTLELPVVVDKESMSEKISVENISKLDKPDRMLDYLVYCQNYNSTIKKNELVAIGLKFDMTSFDTSDPKFPLYCKVYDKMFNKDEDGKSFKKDKYYEGVLLCEYKTEKTEAESVEFTEWEKELIELGLVNESEIIKEKGGAKGKSVARVIVKRIKAGYAFTEKEINEDTDFYINEIDTVVETNREAISQGETTAKPFKLTL